MNNTSIGDIKSLQISDFDYPLPDERIARHPLAERERCKLLCYNGNTITDCHFADLVSLLPGDTMLVYNNTRVINARIKMRKPSGGAVEIFCLEPVEPADYALMFGSTGQCTWRCLVGNSKRWKQGDLTTVAHIGDHDTTVTATRGCAEPGGSWQITFKWDDSNISFAQLIDNIGVIPIPPYLNRETESSDATDYQTVFSRVNGSVAAPTAGLHFTSEMLQAIDARGIERREVTLHVGAGTFMPVKSSDIGGHEMHHELYLVDRSLIAELAAGQRTVTAVGTTSVRTLESLYHVGCILDNNPDADDLTVTQWMPYTTGSSTPVPRALDNILKYLDDRHLSSLVGSTQLMIAPGYEYRIVQGMVTNFHQPQSTLLLLVSAFLGGDHWREVYIHALANGYRFLSYGDACYFTRR